MSLNCQRCRGMNKGNVKVFAKLLKTTKFTKSTKEQPVENKERFFVKSFFRALCVLRGD